MALIIHHSALKFIEWFICNAGREPLSQAPSNEKLEIWLAVQSAIVEKIASLLSVHFHRYINAHHSSLFPHDIRRFPSDCRVARGSPLDICSCARHLP
jgi:hypothetical protein